MSEIYSTMKELSDRWGEDATSIINEDVLFPDFTNCDDAVAK